MVESIFSSCTEACGWIAAVTAVLSFGSFGVPIKLASNVEVHPLVMQSYKTLVCFMTCWLVILLGEEVRFSYYGILSGKKELSVSLFRDRDLISRHDGFGFDNS